jgi:hypothetical protein
MSAPTPEELEAYRAELRTWIEANLPGWWREERATATQEIPEERFED